MKILLSPPELSGNELKYLQEVLESGWLAPLGPHVDKFENRLSNVVKSQYCVALNSGTSAIHLALILAGVTSGDEVICQSFTFCGSANPILYLKAIPVFVDSEASSWNMDPDCLELAIKNRLKFGKKPKAVIAIDLYGMPAQWEKISEICREHDVVLIEDAAEALGSTYLGQACGQWGDFNVLSFNGNKMISTSGGGALLSNNQKAIERARFLASQAKEDAPHYQHKELGYNYRLSSLCAAVGIAQLEDLGNRVARKRAIFEFYKKKLSETGLFEFQKEESGVFSNRWLTTVVLKENSKLRSEFLQKTLNDSGIETRPLWKPMHLQPLYKDFQFFGDGISKSLFERGLCLPSGVGLSDDQLEFIGQKLLEATKTLHS